MVPLRLELVMQLAAWRAGLTPLVTTARSRGVVDKFGDEIPARLGSAAALWPVDRGGVFLP